MIGFDPSMAFDRFIPNQGIYGSLSEPEMSYIRGLVRHAEELGKQPLLCCTRSLGRTFALKKALPGTHILIYRNLFHQWCSYCEQAIVSANYYFLRTIPQIIESNIHDRFFSFLHEEFKGIALDSTAAFERFVLFHLYLYGRCYDGYDIVVDVNLAYKDHHYRNGIEARVLRKCGVPVDLNSIRESIAFTFTAHGSPAELSARLDFLKEIVAKEIQSIGGRGFVDKCVVDIVDEFGRYFFYTKNISEFAFKLVGSGEKA